MRRLDAITGILGHETGHAFQAEAARKALYELDYQVQMKIRDAGDLGVVDIIYT